MRVLFDNGRPRLIDRRHAVLRRKVDDELPVDERQSALEVQTAIHALSSDRRERTFQFAAAFVPEAGAVNNALR